MGAQTEGAIIRDSPGHDHDSQGRSMAKGERPNYMLPSLV